MENDPLTKKQIFYGVLFALFCLTIFLTVREWKKDKPTPAEQTAPLKTELNANKAITATNVANSHKSTDSLRKVGNDAVKSIPQPIKKRKDEDIPNADYTAMFEHIIQPTTAD